MDFDKSSPVVIALAKEFMSAVCRIAPTWNRAFWRFESEEFRFGSNASYVTPDGVFLVSAMKESAMYDALNALGRQLWDCEPEPKKRFCVCLLGIENSFDYEIKFEREDISKWRITKIDGKSGIPDGL
ncbi:MAG: hypothetical protein ACK4OE_06065 [Acidovorax sp.]|uniref:hypothetical protein n=1 Tax=Acidovorax sp. TaxID=1872122 RepID=UPI00391A5820